MTNSLISIASFNQGRTCWRFPFQQMSLAVIAKYVSVLEQAGLITKRRSGKEKVVQIQPKMIEVAATYLSEYEKIWSTRFDALEKLLEDKS